MESNPPQSFESFVVVDIAAGCLGLKTILYHQVLVQPFQFLPDDYYLLHNHVFLWHLCMDWNQVTLSQHVMFRHMGWILVFLELVHATPHIMKLTDLTLLLCIFGFVPW